VDGARLPRRRRLTRSASSTTVGGRFARSPTQPLKAPAKPPGHGPRQQLEWASSRHVARTKAQAFKIAIGFLCIESPRAPYPHTRRSYPPPTEAAD